MKISEQEMRQFKKAMGEAFQSQPDLIPGGFLVGKYLAMGCDENIDSKELAVKMRDDMKEQTFMELVEAMSFINQTVDLLNLLKLAMFLLIREEQLYNKKN